ncbi:unnamed protein product, partial [Eruca vesicaria subsp. sativa]|nr:unnamed protein product [Eruca vesicaria subsp. sativa]
MNHSSSLSSTETATDLSLCGSPQIERLGEGRCYGRLMRDPFFTKYTRWMDERDGRKVHRTKEENARQ